MERNSLPAVRQVELNSGKDTLRGKVFIPEGEGPFPGVIFFHGSGSSGDTYFEISEKLMSMGILAFMFNFRGCGYSDGKFEEQTVGMGLEDAKVGLDYFLGLKELDKNRVGLSGSSYGGFLAALLSDEFDFKTIVLIVPASYSPLHMNTLHIDEKNKLNEGFDQSISYKKIGDFKGKLLIIQSENDDVLPNGMVEKYVEEARGNQGMEHFILKDAKHRIKLNPKAKKQMIKKVKSWFKETL